MKVFLVFDVVLRHFVRNHKTPTPKPRFQRKETSAIKHKLRYAKFVNLCIEGNPI